MDKFVKNILPDTSIRGLVRLMLAMILTILLVVHLFRFEELTGVLGELFELQSGAAIGFGAILVLAELAVLPVFLGMPLPSAAKVVGVSSGCLAAALWILIGFVAGLASNGGDTGFLGSLIYVPGEMAIISMCASLIAVLLIVPVRR